MQQYKHTGTYASETKAKVRARIFKHLPKGKPSVLTLAGPQGLCVKYILSKRPHARIVNVERDARILRKFKRLNLPVTSVHTDLETFVNDKYNLWYHKFVFADFVGYVSPSMLGILARLSFKGSKTIAITVQSMKGFRGRSAKKLAKLFGEHGDATLRAIKMTLGKGYKVIDDFEYKQEHCTHSMRVIIVTLKGK